MSNAKILDLDAKLGFAASEAPVHVKQVRLFGAEWTIICDVNSFTLSRVMSGNPEAVVDFLINAVEESQRVAFVKVMSDQKDLSPERLGSILNAFVEVAAERPTTPPSASGSTPAKKTSGRNSGASTARRQVVRSTS